MIPLLIIIPILLIVSLTIWLLVTSRVCKKPDRPLFKFSTGCVACPTDKPNWNSGTNACVKPCIGDTPNWNSSTNLCEAKIMKKYENQVGPPNISHSVIEGDSDYIYDYAYDDYKVFKLSSLDNAKEICLKKDECKAISCTKTGKQPGYCYYYSSAPKGVHDTNGTYYVKT